MMSYGKVMIKMIPGIEKAKSFQETIKENIMIF